MKTKAVILVLMIACAVPAANAACTTIKDGVLKYKASSYLSTNGQPFLKVGFDAYGYNYQAHLFNGSYFNAYANGAGFAPYEGGDDTAYLTANPGAGSHWAWPYRFVTLNMKWNDAWLSNQDCGDDSGSPIPDGKLDRHYGFAQYKGSGAWLTNHESDMEDGAHWSNFTKIVAVPFTAILGGTSCPSDPPSGTCIFSTADGSEIGYEIWGEFAIIQQVYNDPAVGLHGVQYKSPTNPGWGFYQP